jgi:hypothetical protein
MPDVMKTVGRYEILRDLGRGGMAIVYLARQTDLDRFVALKELGAFHASDPQVVQRFLRESRMAGSLSHPNIVVVYDYFEHAGTPYIAMEYIERGSLRPHVGRLTLNQIAGVLEGLLAGLAHAEQQGIVHRDLKPENVMITADGRVKIADFGIAKATNRMQTGAFLTATGTTVGTPTYMAPEQAMAQEIGPWTDLYSVGVMAFELFVGRTPFHDSEAPMAILLRHVNEQIPAVKSLVPDVDQEISDWIERLVVKEPAKRMRSAQEAWDELEEIIIGRLGPRWRRGARLVERARQVDTPKPLTPAPFHGTSADEAIPDDFDSLPVGPDTPMPAETPTAPPGPATPPPEAGAAPAAPSEPATAPPEAGEGLRPRRRKGPLRRWRRLRPPGHRPPPLRLLPRRRKGPLRRWRRPRRRPRSPRRRTLRRRPTSRDSRRTSRRRCRVTTPRRRLPPRRPRRLPPSRPRRRPHRRRLRSRRFPSLARRSRSCRSRSLPPRPPSRRSPRRRCRRRSGPRRRPRARPRRPRSSGAGSLYWWPEWR